MSAFNKITKSLLKFDEIDYLMELITNSVFKEHIKDLFKDLFKTPEFLELKLRTAKNPKRNLKLLVKVFSMYQEFVEDEAIFQYEELEEIVYANLKINGALGALREIVKATTESKYVIKPAYYKSGEVNFSHYDYLNQKLKRLIDAGDLSCDLSGDFECGIGNLYKSFNTLKNNPHFKAPTKRQLSQICIVYELYFEEFSGEHKYYLENMEEHIWNVMGINTYLGGIKRILGLW
jgi:hypothetical protein